MEEINSSSARSDRQKPKRSSATARTTMLRRWGTPPTSLTSLFWRWLMISWGFADLSASVKQLCTSLSALSTAVRSKVTKNVREATVEGYTSERQMSQLTRAARTAFLIPRTRVPCSHRPREKIKEAAGYPEAAATLSAFSTAESR